MKFIGIDIAKDTFVAAYPKLNGYKTQTFNNDLKGVKKFIGSITETGYHCVLEATGNYGTLLLYLLCNHNVAVSLVNPKQIKHFARMMMAVTKTDHVDAKLIAQYGEKMTPAIFKMPSDAIILMKQKRVVLRQLKKQLTSLTNLRGSFDVLPNTDKSSLSALNRTIKFVQKQILELQADLSNVANEQFSKQIKALTSIKGIGLTLATSLIISTGGFTQFENAKQLSRYIGICPTYQQSGTSINIKGTINRNGDSDLRSLLYIASWSAIRYNQACKESYQRLKAKGKPSKVALIAVANKLVRQAFAICKAESIYVNDYSYKLKII
jgi:transposase